MTDVVEVLHFHLFAGLGGAARGMNRGEARLGAMEARFRCIGGVDGAPLERARWAVEDLCGELAQELAGCEATGG